MAHKQITLDLAAFLDSSEAAALEQPDRAGVRQIAERFLGACYDDLGTVPRMLDGHDVHTVFGHLLPGRFKRADPLAEHVPAVLTAYFDHLETTQVVSQAWEVRRALDSTESEFLEAVRSGKQVHHHAPKQAPFVHHASKLGRNDPCSCGSGKKFKKCHGKGT